MVMAFTKTDHTSMHEFLCLDSTFKWNSLLCGEGFATMYLPSLVENGDQVIRRLIGLQLFVILMMHYLNYLHTYYVIIELLQKLQPTFVTFLFKI